MLLYRISRALYCRALTGEGPFRNGGRWNHPGVRCIYGSATRALALLEYTCHAKLHDIPRGLSFVTIEVPDDAMISYAVGQLPGNWKYWPHAPETREFGTNAIASHKYLLHRLPSVIIEDEMNFIIDVAHPAASQIKILDVKDYAYDLRLKTN